MQTEYGRTKFIQCGKTKRHGYYDCRDKGSDAILGVVRWSVFRKLYVFHASNNAAFDAMCLAEILAFINQLS